MPSQAEPGYQITAIRQRMTVGTCLETACEWFLFGHEGYDARGRRWSHPAGAPCGDVKACPDPECPCTARCADTTDPDFLRQFAYIADGGVAYLVGYHYTPITDPGIGLTYSINGRLTVPDEFIQRSNEGFESLRFIRERGL